MMRREFELHLRFPQLQDLTRARTTHIHFVPEHHCDRQLGELMVEKMSPGQLVLDALLLHLDHPRLPPLELGVQRPDHLPNSDHHNVQSHLRSLRLMMMRL